MILMQCGAPVADRKLYPPPPPPLHITTKPQAETYGNTTRKHNTETRTHTHTHTHTPMTCPDLFPYHHPLPQVMADLAVPDDQPRFGAQMPTYIAPTHVCKMIVKRKIRLDSVEGIGLLIQLLPRLTVTWICSRWLVSAITRGLHLPSHCPTLHSSKGPVRGSELVMLANKTCFSTFILWLLFRVLTTKADPVCAHCCRDVCSSPRGSQCWRSRALEPPPLPRFSPSILLLPCRALTPSSPCSQNNIPSAG